MNKTTCFFLMLLGALTAGNLLAADPPAASNPTPVGKWKWFTGPDLGFNIRGEVTGAHRPAVWFWTDEDKRELQIVWGGPLPGLDKVVLSEDGKRLRGANNDETPVSGTRIVEAGVSAAVVSANPVGTWNWFFGPDLTFHEDGTVTGENRTATWSWVDKGKRQLKVDFGGAFAGFTDTLTLSDDGSHLQGVNNTGTDVTGDRVSAAPAADAAVSSSPVPATSKP